jgi:hypothetical protein
MDSLDSILHPSQPSRTAPVQKVENINKKNATPAIQFANWRPTISIIGMDVEFNVLQ